MGIAVVTGASAGIGRATALAFAAEGWDVALISRNEARLGLLRAEIERSGRNALALPLDVAVATDVEAAATRIEEKLGPIEVWVSNAMVSVFSPVHEMSPAEFRRVTEVIYPGFCFTRCASAGCANTRNGCAARCGTSSRTAAFASTTTRLPARDAARATSPGPPSSSIWTSGASDRAGLSTAMPYS